MKNSARLLPVLLFAASAAGGWWLMSRASTENAVVSQVAPVALPPTRASDEALAPLRAAKDRWTAIHAAIQLAHDIPAAERRAWLKGGRFQHGDPLVVRIFRSELEELLFTEDPYSFIAAEVAVETDSSAGMFLARLAKMDPAKLIDFGKATANPEHGRRMIFAGMQELVKSDPATVLKLALEFPPPKEDTIGTLPTDMLRLLAKAASGDSEKLLDLADERGDRWRLVLRAAAAQAMVAKDVPGALRWMQASPDGPVIFAGVFNMNNRSMDEVNATARLLAEHLADFPDGFSAAVDGGVRVGWPSNYQMSGVEDLWLKADLARLGYDDSRQAEIRSTALAGLVRRDPAAAAKYLADSSFLPAETRKNLMDELGQLFSITTEGIPPEIASVLGETDLKKMQDRRAAYLANKEKPQMVPSVPEQFEIAMTEKGSNALMLESNRWSREDVQQAVEYVRQAPQDKLREMAKRLRYTGGPLPDVAGEIYRLALAQKLGDAKMSEGIVKLSITWGYTNSPDAAAWVESLPAGPERQASIRNVAAQWSFDDPAAVERWISGLKDPAEADAAREALKITREKSH